MDIAQTPVVNTVRKRPLLGIGLVIVLIIASFFLLTYKRGGVSLIGSKTGISSNILYLTQPVYSFSGTIESVNSGSITVSQTVTPQVVIAPPVITTPGSTIAPQPTPASQKLTYTVTISPTTSLSINSNTPPIAAAPGVAITPAPKVTEKDFKVGQRVSVSSATDLRTITGNSFVAQSISIQVSNVISGTITAVSGNTISVRAFVADASVALSAPQTKDFQIAVSASTDITRTNFSAVPGGAPAAPEKLSLSDLKKDMQVSITTDSDVLLSTSRLTALRISVTPTFAPPPVVAAPIAAPTTAAPGPATATTPVPTTSVATPTP